MHAVVIPCPHCGKELKLKDRSLIGKKGKCPGCAQTFLLEEPALSDEVQLELVQPPPASVAPEPAFGGFELPVAIPTADTGGVGRLKEIRRKNRRRRNIGMIVGALLACAIGGTYQYVKKIRADHQRDLAAAEAAKKPQQDDKYLSSIQSLKDNNDRFAVTSPTQGDPIVLNFMPAGSKVVINLNPSTFWTAGTKGEEFRYCLGPVGEWVGTKVQELSGFEPSRIERMMICLIPGLRGEKPEVAALVRLTEVPTRFEMIKRFQGEQLNPGKTPEVYLSGKLCYIYVDEQTFAVGPANYRQEMVDAIESGAQTDPDIERILPQTDRDRHLTLIFDPAILRIEQEAWFPENVRPFLNQTLDWIGDDVRAVAWSVHLGERFHSELTLRNDKVIPAATLQKTLKKRLDELPYRVLAAVEMMQPTEYGKRRIISRFPAMTKALAMATEGGIGQQEVRFNTVLNERAAPNLALGTLLAWDESTRTDFNRTITPPTAVAANDTPSPGEKELTLAEKLNKRIEVDFRRSPLQDAITYLSDESKIAIEVDGDGLKAPGFTQNMTQTLAMENATVKEALLAIITGKANPILKDNPDQIILILDKSEKGLILTTRTFFTNQGKEPPKCQIRP